MRGRKARRLASNERGSQTGDLQQSPLGEGHDVVADHNMIEHAHVNQRQRIFQALRDVAIGRTRFGHTGRMIVRKYNRRGIVLQRLANDFSRVHAGAVDGPVNNSSNAIMRWRLSRNSAAKTSYAWSRRRMAI